MKVLSLKEPWASLIKDEIKCVETRSWKTNYRGELYIHASLSKVSSICQENRELMRLVKSQDYPYGCIICKCKLVDCIKMTEEYVEDMRLKNPIEYACGDYKVNRYAWILSDIEPVTPIEVKGHLGIWNYEI